MLQQQGYIFIKLSKEHMQYDQTQVFSHFYFMALFFLFSLVVDFSFHTIFTRPVLAWYLVWSYFELYQTLERDETLSELFQSFLFGSRVDCFRLVTQRLRVWSTLDNSTDRFLKYTKKPTAGLPSSWYPGVLKLRDILVSNVPNVSILLLLLWNRFCLLCRLAKQRLQLRRLRSSQPSVRSSQFLLHVTPRAQQQPEVNTPPCYSYVILRPYEA